MKHVWIFGPMVLIIGCGGRDSGPTQPFELGRPRILEPGQPAGSPSESPGLVVSRRDGGGSVRPGHSIPCEVKLTARDNRSLPQALTLELIQNDRVFDTCDALPSEVSGDGVYRLRGQLTAPEKPGRYQVRAVAAETEIRQSATRDTDPTVTSFLTKSPPIEVEVRP